MASRSAIVLHAPLTYALPWRPVHQTARLIVADHGGRGILSRIEPKTHADRFVIVASTRAVPWVRSLGAGDRRAGQAGALSSLVSAVWCQPASFRGGPRS